MQGYSPDRMQGDAAAAATANRPGLSLHSHQPEGDQDANIYRLTGEPSCKVNDGRVLVAAAVAGHGVILQPAVVVDEALKRGDLVRLLTDYVAPSRTLHLLYPPSQPQPVKLRAFIAHLTAALTASGRQIIR